MTNYKVKTYSSKDAWKAGDEHVAFAEIPKRSLAMAVGELMATEYGFAVVYIDEESSRSFFYKD